MRPDPRIDIRDIRNINNTTPRINDDVTVYDSTKPNNKWKGSDAYNKKIDGNYKYTDKNWKQAFNEAAKSGKPLVIVFGSEKTNDAERLVEGPTKSSRDGGKDAVHLYVDKDRIGKDTQLGQFVEKNIGNQGLDLAYTGIFSLKPGADGKPELGKMVANTWGARSEISSVIQDQLKYAQNRMDQHKGKFKIDESVDPDSNPGDDTNPDKKTEPEEKTEPRDKKKPDDKVEPEKPADKVDQPKETQPETAETKLLKGIFNQRKEIFGSIARGGQSFTERTDNSSALEKALQFKTGEGDSPKLTKEERLAHFDRAVTAADQVKPEEVKQARELLEQQRKRFSEKGKGLSGQDKIENSKQVEMLKTQRDSMSILEKADGIARLERGLFRLDESDYDEGVADIKEAFKRQPDLAKDQAYIDRIARSPYLTENLKKDFPNLPIEEARERLEQEKPKPKTTDNADRDKVDNQDKDVSPSEDESQKEPPVEKPETKPETEVKDKPIETDKPDPVKEQEAAQRLLSSAAKVKQLMNQVTANTPFADAQAIYAQALSIAEGKPIDGVAGINPKDVQTVKSSFQRSLQEEQASDNPDQNEITKLESRIRGLERISESSDAVKLERGKFTISSTTSGDSERFRQGLRDLSEVAKKHPDILNSNAQNQLPREIVQKGLESGATAREIQEALPYDSINAELNKLPKKFEVKSPEDFDAPKKMAHFLDKNLLVKARANYCAPCKVSEARVYPDKAVDSLIKEHGVFANIDLSDPPEGMQELVGDKLGVEGLPTNLVAKPVLQNDGSIELEELGRTDANFLKPISEILKLSEKLAAGQISQAQYDSQRANYGAQAARVFAEFLESHLKK